MKKCICDAKGGIVDVVLKSIMMNNGHVLYDFLSDIGVVANKKARAVIIYGG